MVADEALMEQYQQGDVAAFEELYHRHSGKVFGYLLNHLHGDREAEDLLQQVFLKLHHYRARYDVSLPFLPWVFSITRNALIDYTRKRRPTPVESAQLERIPQPVREASLSFSEAVSGLPSEQRTLLELRYEQGLSFEEISKRTGVPSTSIRKRASRAIAVLREKFKAGGNRP